MTARLKGRVARLEASAPAGTPAEVARVLDALLAAARERAGMGRMTDEQRAVYEAPDFQARAEAARAWERRHVKVEVGDLLRDLRHRSQAAAAAGSGDGG